MSDDTTISPMEQPQTVSSNGHDPDKTLYQKICHALNTEQGEDETSDDFKIRVITEFSDMKLWPNDKYEMLDKDVQDWVFDATTTHKSNRDKQRKKALPILTGLDQVGKAKRGRASLHDEIPVRRGRTRANGDDCLTRTMRLLVAEKNPENLKSIDLVKTLETKYGKEYSTAAVRYAQQAFLTARELLKQQQASSSAPVMSPTTATVAEAAQPSA